MKLTVSSQELKEQMKQPTHHAALLLVGIDKSTAGRSKSVELMNKLAHGTNKLAHGVKKLTHGREKLVHNMQEPAIGVIKFPRHSSPPDLH